MITWQKLSEERAEESMLIAHGLEERTVQEWFFGETFPTKEDQESMGASLRLLGGAWVLTR